MQFLTDDFRISIQPRSCHAITLLPIMHHDPSKRVHGIHSLNGNGLYYQISRNEKPESRDSCSVALKFAPAKFKILALKCEPSDSIEIPCRKNIAKHYPYSSLKFDTHNHRMMVVKRGGVGRINRFRYVMHSV